MSPKRKDASKDPRAEAEESPKQSARSGEHAKSSRRSPVVTERDEESHEGQRESTPPESAPPRSTDRSSAREESSNLIGVQTSKATLYVYVAPRSSKKRRERDQ